MSILQHPTYNPSISSKARHRPWSRARHFVSGTLLLFAFAQSLVVLAPWLSDGKPSVCTCVRDQAKSSSSSVSSSSTRSSLVLVHRAHVSKWPLRPPKDPARRWLSGWTRPPTENGLGSNQTRKMSSRVEAARRTASTKVRAGEAARWLHGENHCGEHISRKGRSCERRRQHGRDATGL